MGTKRKKARELTMQLLFQAEAQKCFEDDMAEKYIENSIKGDESRDYARRVFRNVKENIQYIDEAINRFSRNWSTDRMPKIDLAVARLSAAEILFLDDVPDIVSVNEAVELAKEFGTEKSPKFLNGILGQIIKYKDEEKIHSGD